jgi:hypothetical protein
MNGAMCPNMAQETGMQAEARDADREPSGSAPRAASAPAHGNSRALVPIQPIETGARFGASRYPSATFLAHLIAVERRVPQMRTRGRTAPREAVAIYSAAAAEPPSRIGRKLRRSA